MDGGQLSNASLKRSAPDTLAPPKDRQRARINDGADEDVEDLTQEDIELPSSSAQPSFDSPPLHLFKVTAGIPDFANEGFLGATLANLVSGSNIQWAFVSNYMVDWAFVLSACPALISVPSLLLVHGERAGGSMKIHQDMATAGMTSRVTLHTPPLPAYGTHHSKAFILQYPRGLRVIIHTANLIYCDCNNKTQGLSYQDFPLKDAISPQISPFEKDLKEYLVGLRLPPASSKKVADIIALHDFSAARVHLIASIPSEANLGHTGHRFRSFGHLKLKACLDQEPGGFDAKFSGAPVLAQYSSIGSLSAKWLESFTQSVSGGMAATADGASRPVKPLGTPREGLDGVHLVWPTTDEVQNSVEGWFAGGSIPGFPDKVQKEFLQKHYRRWGGASVGRQRAMPHIKSFTRFDAASKEVAWMCVTSHNLSKAAWGEVQESRKYRCTALKILSYELGVLLVPSLEKAYRCSRWYGFSCTDASQAVGPMQGIQSVKKVRFVQWQRGMSQAASISESILTVPLPVPYSLPPMKYQPRDIPWDVRGNGYPPWQGIDALGAKYPGVGVHYGVLQQMRWADVISGSHDGGRLKEMFS